MKAIKILTFMLTLSACSKGGGMMIDSGFTESLFIPHIDRKVLDSILSIDIYKADESEVTGFANDFSMLDKKKVATVRGDKAVNFIISVNNSVYDMPGCFENRENDTYHFLVKANNNKIGYFIVNKCGSDVVVRYLIQGGDTGVVYNKKSILTNIVN